MMILFVPLVCSASKISGTYVRCAANLAEMLQLTETTNGQISGVLSWAELKSDGRVTSEGAPVSGTIDADQVTLNIRSGLLSFLIGNSVAGTVEGSTMQLQMIDSSGNVATHVFARGTAAEFKAYADQLKSKGAAIVRSRKLTDGAQQFRLTVQHAERWIANAELHAQRIPTVKTRYQEIEARMQSLVATERTTPNSVGSARLTKVKPRAGIKDGQNCEYILR
jgi:hypothetical protein